MFYERKFIAGVRNIFCDGILDKVRVSLDYTKCTETTERFPTIRTLLYLGLDVLLALQCTFPYSPSPRSFHINVGNEKYVITFATKKLFGLVGTE